MTSSSSAPRDLLKGIMLYNTINDEARPQALELDVMEVFNPRPGCFH